MEDSPRKSFDHFQKKTVLKRKKNLSYFFDKRATPTETFSVGLSHHLSSNKWRRVTMSLRTGGQGYPTPIHSPTHLQPSNIHKKYWKRSFSTRSPWRTDGRTDGQSLLWSCVFATKKCNKARYTASPVACGWAGAIIKGGSSIAKNPISAEKVKCACWLAGQTDRPTNKAGCMVV